VALNDRPGAQKADTGHHAIGNPGRINGNGDPGRRLPAMRGKLDRDDHHQGAADADEHVGPQARLAAANLALEPDQPAQQRCHDQPDHRFHRPAGNARPVVNELIDVIQHDSM
jgi:hypothetical protein